jgi:hypothetical protein
VPAGTVISGGPLKTSGFSESPVNCTQKTMDLQRCYAKCYTDLCTFRVFFGWMVRTSGAGYWPIQGSEKVRGTALRCQLERTFLVVP